jgi:ABC-type nitrate/sulfonate/bicarbonate transport system substrate-binding protein
LAWIFYGWQGIQAEQQSIPLDMVMMDEQFSCIPDYYTPLLIASRETIENRPERVRRFVRAVSRGYSKAATDPSAAAAALLAASPELDPALVQASQDWISPRYRADAPRWGEQSAPVWQAYADWMVESGILNRPIDMSPAFTNEFLP